MQNNSSRKAALQRIENTPELTQYGFLAQFDHWKESEDLWKWLATAPTDDINKWSHSLSQQCMQSICYHEAGHAVVRFITGGQVNFISTIPHCHLGYMGTVNAYDPSMQYWQAHFLFWRGLAGSMAGLLAEWKYRGKFTGGSRKDIEKISEFLGCIVPQQNHLEWLGYVLVGTMTLIEDPILWDAIETIAKYLYTFGEMDGRELASIVNKVISLAPKRTEVVRNVQKMQGATMEIDRHGLGYPNMAHCKNVIEKSNHIFEQVMTVWCQNQVSRKFTGLTKLIDWYRVVMTFPGNQEIFVKRYNRNFSTLPMRVAGIGGLQTFCENKVVSQWIEKETGVSKMPALDD